MAKRKSINLLPQEEFDASVLGRSLKWAMGSFRIIVIATEMVVMAAFLSRFWLDAQNSDLSESIKIASARIQAQSDFEKEFRGVQKKLSIFKQITAAPKYGDKVDAISSKVPAEVILSSVTVQDATGVIKGITGNELSVAQFISNLKADKSFKKVELASLGSSQSGQTGSGLTFVINITY